MAHSQKSATLRRMLKLVLLVSILCFGIKALALHPLFIRLAANVIYKDAWYTNILYYLIDGGLIDLAVFSVCYPAALYAVWKDGLKNAKSVPIAFSLVTAGKFVANYVMTCVTEGSFVISGRDLLVDLSMIIPMLLLELLQLWAPIVVLARRKRHYDEQTAAAVLGHTSHGEGACASVLPITRLLSLRNPLQLSALLYSLILFVGLEVSYHTYQLTLYNYYGETDGWLGMLLNLMTDLAFGVALYFIAILLFNRFHNRESASEA